MNSKRKSYQFKSCSLLRNWIQNAYFDIPESIDPHKILVISVSDFLACSDAIETDSHQECHQGKHDQKQEEVAGNTDKSDLSLIRNHYGFSCNTAICNCCRNDIIRFLFVMQMCFKRVILIDASGVEDLLPQNEAVDEDVTARCAYIFSRLVYAVSKPKLEPNSSMIENLAAGNDLLTSISLDENLELKDILYLDSTQIFCTEQTINNLLCFPKYKCHKHRCVQEKNDRDDENDLLDYSMEFLVYLSQCYDVRTEILELRREFDNFEII